MKLILIIVVKDLVDEPCNFNEKFGDKVKLPWINTNLDADAFVKQ